MGVIFARTGQARLIIHEEAVASHIQPGGPVHGLLRDIAYDTRDWGKAYVADGHVRSGRLLRGIAAAQPQSTGPLQAASRASSSARHTIFFMEKTADIIKGNPHLVVPKRRAAHTNPAFSGAGAQKLAEWGKKSAGQQKGGKGVFRPDFVKGYRAHPFLQEGLQFSLAKHGLK